MSAIWPAAVATQLQLLTAINNTKVTLAVNAGVGDTTITVDDHSALPNSGYLTFADNEDSPETIYYTGKSGSTDLTGVTRGADGTAAGTHTAGAFLDQRPNAAYHNLLVTEIIALAQNLANRFGLNTNIIIPTGISVQAVDGIGIGGALDAKAILSLVSTTKGFLPPKMTTTQRDAIVTPTEGLMIYNTSTKQYNLYDGSNWLPLVPLNSAGDLVLSTAAKGIIVTTPDGAHTVRIAVSNLDADNNSSVTTEMVS